MAKKQIKKLNRDDSPDILDKVLSLLNKELDNLAAQEALTSEDTKNVIAIAGAVSTIYKEYKLELKTLDQDLSKMSKQELMSLVRVDKAS
jgi:lipase chaperone LimK